MSNFEKLKRTLNEMSKANVKLNLVRAIVTQVDWSSKTMTVKGLVDDLEYFDVLLGLGSYYRKPKVGSSCLMGVYDGHKTAGFLLEVENFEEAIFKSKNSEFTIKESGFIIKNGSENLKDIMNDMFDELNKILVINGTTINVASMEMIKQRLNTILTS